MVSPQADYVMQHTKKIEQLLREAGGGNLDRKLETLIDKMESARSRLGDINQRRELTRLQYDLLEDGQKFYQESGETARRH